MRLLQCVAGGVTAFPVREEDGLLGHVVMLLLSNCPWPWWSCKVLTTVQHQVQEKHSLPLDIIPTEEP